MPFRDCSFVLKIQCEERGVTGVREAVLLDEKLGSGEVHLNPESIVNTRPLRRRASRRVAAGPLT